MKFPLCPTFSILTAAVLVFGSGCKPAEPTPVQAPALPAPFAPPANATVEAKPSDAKTITPEEAGNHIGKVMTVRGKVDRVHVSQKGDVFMDMGGKDFTAVCFKQAIPTTQLQAFDGKVVSISGKIKEYNGKVEIILDSADQIKE